MPTTMFTATSLDCTPCMKFHMKHSSQDNCQGDKFQKDPKFSPVDGVNVTNPGHNAWWAKKWCTMNEVHDFTLYFPYMLIILPLCMVASERGFDKYVFLSFYASNPNYFVFKIL